jgi:hypothetical protein
MKTCAEDESDAAKPRDYSSVGTLVVLFKGPFKRGRCSIDNVPATNSGNPIDASIITIT